MCTGDKLVPDKVVALFALSTRISPIKIYYSIPLIIRVVHVDICLMYQNQQQTAEQSYAIKKY